MPQYAASSTARRRLDGARARRRDGRVQRVRRRRPPPSIRGGAALYPTSTATTVRVTGGKGGDVVTSDGPYAETKEVLTGFYLLECADLDEAVRVASAIPTAWNGAVEVRPVVDFGR